MSVNSPDGDSCWSKTSILYLIPQSLHYLNLVITESWVIFWWDSSIITPWFSTAVHFFFPFSPPKSAPLHSWQTNPCTRYLQSWRSRWAQTQLTALKYFMGFAKGDFCKCFFLPGWMYRQRSRKIIDQSYQQDHSGGRNYKGRNGKWKHYLQQVWLHQSFELCRRSNFISVLPFVLFNLLLVLEI